jgi:hypothetical protein
MGSFANLTSDQRISDQDLAFKLSRNFYYPAHVQIVYHHRTANIYGFGKVQDVLDENNGVPFEEQNLPLYEVANMAVDKMNLVVPRFLDLDLLDVGNSIVLQSLLNQVRGSRERFLEKYPQHKSKV